MTATVTHAVAFDGAGPQPLAVVSRQLPGAAVTSIRLPWAETAVFVTVLPLLSIPAMVATMGAPWAAVGAVVLTSVVAWLCLVRHAVVGRGWVADRRFFRYRVTEAQNLRAVDLVENGHGGLLRLHPLTGRPHRLRAHEFSGPQAREALADLLAASDASVCRGATNALGMAERPAAVGAGPG